MKTSLTEVSEADRQELLDSMHPLTAELASDGAEKLTRFRNAGVLLMFELGCRIDSLSTDETIEDGDGEVTKLAVYWGQENTNRLYEWRNTAAAFCKVKNDEGEIVYDKSAVLEMLKQPLQNGNQLEFEHFKHLGRISHAKTRKALLTQVRKNNWSANALLQEIKGRSSETKNTRSGGRKPQVPSSVFQFSQKVHAQGQQFNNFLYAAEEAIPELFSEVPTDKVDGKFITKLDDTIELLNLLSSTIDKTVDMLVDGREHVQMIVSGEEGNIEDDVDNPLVAEIMPMTQNAQAEEEDSANEYITGTAIAAKVAEAGSSTEKTAKKRGRPKGSKNKK